jgi:c-di-GMP-binding flagellar brake protein YcgR
MIQIKDKEIIKRHLILLAERKLHCKVSKDDIFVNGRFDAFEDEKLEIIIYLQNKDLLNQADSVEVEYLYDNVLHGFKSDVIKYGAETLYLQQPAFLEKYQLRRYKRIHLEKQYKLKLQFNFLSEELKIEELKDIGEGGVGFHLKELPSRAAKDIRINSIKLLLKENTTLHLSGILRYIKKIEEDHDPLFRIGIEFDPLKDNDRLTLLDFIEEMSKE